MPVVKLLFWVCSALDILEDYEFIEYKRFKDSN